MPEQTSLDRRRLLGTLAITTESESHSLRYFRIDYGGESHCGIGDLDGSARRERH